MFGLIGTDDETLVLANMAGVEVEQEEPAGVSPSAALAALKTEKPAAVGYVAAGGFAMPMASRTPHRVHADFTGADPRFREPIMSGSDGAAKPVNNGEPIVLKPTGLTLGHGATITASAIAPPAGYPDGNPKTLMGAKKPDLSVVPPVALLHLATAMMNGAEKYGPFNWRDQSISYRPYLAAAMRHLASCLDGEDFSTDTIETGLPVHHLGHVMACCSIILDAVHCGTMNDNRPKVPGQTGQAIELYNEKKQLLPTPPAA